MLEALGAAIVAYAYTRCSAVLTVGEGVPKMPSLVHSTVEHGVMFPQPS